MIFDGNDLSRWLLVTSVKRAVAPSRRLTATEVPGMAGAHVADGGLGTLTVEVGAHLRAVAPADVSDLRRALAAALHRDAAAPLVLDDEPGRYLMAWYEGGAELSRNSHMPGVTLSFLCADPVAYGEARTATVSTTARQVLAGGTYRAWPTVTCKPASGSYWQLTNVTTGDYVRVDATFDGTQTVTLDMAAERCLVNGSDHAVTVASDFFALDGAQALKASSGTATLEWDERWL